MPTWPASLPQNLQYRGFTQGLQPGIIRQDMDVGPAKIRHRSQSRYRPIDGSVIVDQTQLQAFIDFFENDLAQGSLSFTWNDPIFGEAETFRFVEPPSWSPHGHGYQVRLSLEMRVVGTRRPLRASDPWSLGMTESTGDIVPTSP